MIATRRLIAAAIGLVLPLTMIAAADAATGVHRRARPAHVSTATYHAPSHRTHHTRVSAHSRSHTQQPRAAVVGS
jgi:hypothetical protein